MKRMELTQTTLYELSLPSDLPEELVNYVSQLKLLYDVPFSYLVAEERALPPESLRFFYIDSSWTDALIAGALSIGQVSAAEVEADRAQLMYSAPVAAQQLRTVRQKKMHENHKKGLRASDALCAGTIQTGFLLRSVLTRRMKGLEVLGCANDVPLEILRMEELSSDVLICIFDGEVDDLVIAEPKTGLRFGCPDEKRIIQVRATTDDEKFGKYLDKTVDVGALTQSNGRLDVSKLAQTFREKLGAEVGSAQMAFELIATAHRAEFTKK